MDGVVLDRNRVLKSLKDRSSIDPGVTFVAMFSKRRPWVFDTLVQWLDGSLRSQLSNWLEKQWITLAPAGQIHITLIGMEATLDRGELVSRNLKAIRKEIEPRPMAMDLAGLATYLRVTKCPIRLRFGGFSPDAVNPYDSRPPYERSFSIRPDGLIVAIGWPVLSDVIQPALVDFRKGAERFGVVHKYHVKETDCDNDGFFVVGAVSSQPWDEEGQPRDGYEDFIAALSASQRQVRECLRAASLEVALGREHCSVVRYSSADLAGVPERDVVPLEAVTPESLYELYADR